jgi:hypothetical protein
VHCVRVEGAARPDWPAAHESREAASTFIDARGRGSDRGERR